MMGSKIKIEGQHLYAFHCRLTNDTWKICEAKAINRVNETKLKLALFNQPPRVITDKARGRETP